MSKPGNWHGKMCKLKIITVPVRNGQINTLDSTNQWNTKKFILWNFLSPKERTINLSKKYHPKDEPKHKYIECLKSLPSVSLSLC